MVCFSFIFLTKTTRPNNVHALHNMGLFPLRLCRFFFSGGAKVVQNNEDRKV